MRCFYFLLFVLGALCSHAQYTGYSLKAGPSMGTQSWDGGDRQPMFGYHVALTVESLSDVKPRSLYASLGYHQRGSSVLSFTARDINNNIFRQSRQVYLFNNIGFSLGGKQTFALTSFRASVGFGIRAEYNLSTNLSDFNTFNGVVQATLPQDEFVNDFLYGIDVSGGLDMSLTPSLDGILELRISPDLSRQYFQPPIQNVILPGSNNPTTLRERSINNITIELSLGLRFVKYNELQDY